MTPNDRAIYSPPDRLGGGDSALHSRLWSLWDMLRTYPHDLGFFWVLFDGLAESFREFSPEAKLPDGIKDRFRLNLPDLSERCSQTEMNSVTAMIDRITRALDGDITVQEAREKLTQLVQRLEDELKTRHFFFVQESLVAYYQSPKDGWESAPDRFPSATPDIEEAGRCLALGRYTASVIHLMRVLEVGLQRLAKKFRVSYENETWSKVINKIQSHITKTEQSKRKPKNWRLDRQFYSEAASEFTVFKDAWRNYSMHVHQKYGDEEAQTIYVAVRSFMRHLAKRLQEDDTR
jgi:hypothetical protein